MTPATRTLLASAALTLAACGPPAGEAYPWRLPADFAPPPVPASNPMSAAKVELGRHLFHDVRLSLNQTQACASCHQPARAFTDGRGQAVGSTGQVHRRGALSLANAGYRATYNWENSLLRTLEQQAFVPLFNVDPIEELALDGHEDVLLARLGADPTYRGLFEDAFPGRPLALELVIDGLASFVRTIVSGDSRWDRFRRGDPGALSADEQAGQALFFGAAGCAQCHSGLTLTDAEYRPDLAPSAIPFHNEGLYNVDGAGGVPELDPGLAVQTGRAEDRGRFRTPTLRNVAVTAPYMHDGSLATLDEVLAHYGEPFSLDARGQRVAASPRRDAAAQAIPALDLEQRRLLKAFLEALTDEGFLSDPRYASPFGSP